METADERRKRLQTERDDLLVELALQGLTEKEIGERLGISYDGVSAEKRRVSKARGIEFPKRALGRNATPKPAYGLTARGEPGGSYRFRVNLSDRLKKLRDKQHPIEVAQTTGLWPNAQTMATSNDPPYGYDWTISQIERLAQAHGLTFNELVTELLQEPSFGFKEKA